MVKNLINAFMAILRGPFVMALGLLALLLVGVAVGTLISASMETSKQEKIKAEKAAAEAALKPPPPPQRVQQPDEGPSPFKPRYVSLGEEILSPLPGKGRVLQTEIDLVTQRGQLSEDLLIANRIPLRALTLSILSELTVEQATADDATQVLAAKLKKAINASLRPANSVTPVERVLIKKFYVQ